jgi:Carboxypeptidase regulatory-like domain
MNPMKSVKKLLCFLFAITFLASLPVCFGQDTSGMTGEVTDQSGAAVPGATVTLKNATTGLQFTATTSAVGAYNFAQIPPGQGYEAIFTASGFATVDIKDIYLTVSTVRTQNATLTVGATAEAVQVTASNSEVTINTSDATVGNTFDVKQLNNLPVQSRSDPVALFTMQPGVTDSGAVTGARTDQNDVTLDGLDVNDFATGGASQEQYVGTGVVQGFSKGTIVGHAPVDSVEEFHGTVGGNLSDTGPSSGGQFQLVTKSGTSTFHGNLNEYHRDPSLVANTWFGNDSGIPRNHLIQNQFGGAVGGPILIPHLLHSRDKLFFFGDFNDDRIISGAVQQRTVPLDSLRNGMIGYPTNSGGNCYLNPTTTSLCSDGTTQPSVKALDPLGAGEDSAWLTGIDARFPHSNNSVTGDGINTGGYAFNAPDNDYALNYVARIDYNMSQNMKLWGRFTISRENAVQNPNQFAGDPPTSEFVDRTYAFVVGHDWVIGSNKTNRIFAGETVQKYNFPNEFNPDKSTFFTFGDGADTDGSGVPTSLYQNPNSQARRVPIPVVGDDFSWSKGRHTVQWGGTFKDILAHDTDVLDYNTTEIGLGGQLYSLCGPTAGACGTGNPSLRPANIDTTSATANTSLATWDQAFAFMLGRIGSVQSDFNYNAAGTALTQLTGDQRFYRFYQTQLYMQDTWKVTPSLTFTYGLTYQLFTVPYETRGLESVEPITFDQYMQARVQQSSLGETGPNAVPLIAYYLGGKGNGSGAQPVYKPEYRNFSPHFGFAWNPGFDKKSVINGSAGIVYDRSIIESILHLQDAYSYLFQQTETTAEGISGDPYDSLKNDPRLAVSTGALPITIIPPATPKPPYEPFTSGGVPFGLLTGSAFNETIDPSLKTPYTYIFNAGYQRSLPGDMVLKANYVGRLGRRLLAQADANQVIEFADPVSGQLYSQAFGNITQALRKDPNYKDLPTQPWFENVVTPGTGVSKGFANNTQWLGAVHGGYVFNGDFGDFTQAISAFTAPNVGMGAQFSENSFHNNKGFSDYHGFLLSLQKNISHGLQYDFNYTLSHSIDNISFFANSQGDTGIGGGGLICDDIRPKECRGSSDFDLRHIISGDATYELPFGRGKMFVNTSSTLVNEIIGGWAISGVTAWHTGYPWQTAANAYVASYSNDAPAILTGNPALAKTHLTKLPNGAGVSDFPNALIASEQFSGPVGFTIGPRNSERGPGYFNADLGLAKNFPITAERVNLKFRADAFNALNHPNFTIPDENVYNGYDQEDYQGGPNFGEISFTADPTGNLNNGARVLQLSLRLEF